MSEDTNKFKGHPGFIAFGSRNIGNSTADTQSERDRDLRNEEIKHDEGLNSNTGGEKGEA